MRNNAITSRGEYRSKKISNLKDFDTWEKYFQDEDLERNGTKVIIDPDFINIGEDIDEFLNKFQSWIFLSKVAKIDFSKWIEFMIIKKRLIKIIKQCQGLKELNLSYCNKDWDDVPLNIKQVSLHNQIRYWKYLF